jgi:hypothetical protein
MDRMLYSMSKVCVVWGVMMMNEKRDKFRPALKTTYQFPVALNTAQDRSLWNMLLQLLE